MGSAMSQWQSPLFIPWHCSLLNVKFGTPFDFCGKPFLCPQLLPKDFDLLCTHPMFGPESGKGVWTGLPFVYDKVRVGKNHVRQDRCERFLKIFEHEVGLLPLPPLSFPRPLLSLSCYSFKDRVKLSRDSPGSCFLRQRQRFS